MTAANEAAMRANILLVDDQPARLMSYEAILAGLGQNLVKARSGTEALQRLMEDDYAAILLDVNMPGMDGFETAAMIHQHPRFERTPIIFVTAVHVTDLDRLKGYELGAVDYVYVPVVPEILRSKVQVLVELHAKRRELQQVNARLEKANADLEQANAALQLESTRELQRLNRTLETANTELATTNRALQAEIAERRRAEAELQEADQRKDLFIAMLAHELRNPLSAIHNGVLVMRLRPSDDPRVEWARDVLERQIKHLTRLIDDLLDVSRIQTGRIKLQRERVDLDGVLRSALETSRPVLERSRHQVDVRMPPDPIVLMGDAVRLTQVFDNVLTNAGKYMEDGGTISVRVERIPAEGEEPPRARVSVRDTGIGIAEDMLPKIFELFLQGDTGGERRQGGMGLGLTLVRGLVELHGGTVQAISAGLGQGSEFVVTLPVLDAIEQSAADTALPAAEALMRTEDAPLREGEEDARQASLRTLIVDDNVDSAQGMAHYLRDLQHDVRVAHSGRAGVEMARAFRPEAILLDLALPDLSGYEVARRLRADADLAGSVLIAVTGFGRDADRRETAAAGFHHHLVKPVDLDQLRSVLREVARRRAEQGAPFA
jgi:signal transduction histidine kinase